MLEQKEGSRHSVAIDKMRQAINDFQRKYNWIFGDLGSGVDNWSAVLAPLLSSPKQIKFFLGQVVRLESDLFESDDRTFFSTFLGDDRILMDNEKELLKNVIPKIKSKYDADNYYRQMIDSFLDGKEDDRQRERLKNLLEKYVAIELEEVGINSMEKVPTGYERNSLVRQLVENVPSGIYSMPIWRELSEEDRYMLVDEVLGVVTSNLS